VRAQKEAKKKVELISPSRRPETPWGIKTKEQ
jgi:hypothetical protein